MAQLDELADENKIENRRQNNSFLPRADILLIARPRILRNSQNIAYYEGANGGTQFSVNYYFFGRISVN